eukprot:6457409-Amphidinium_carterae.1
MHQTHVAKEALSFAHSCQVFHRSLAQLGSNAGVSAALAHIHGFQPPVLHLDLKPANILVVLLPGYFPAAAFIAHSVKALDTKLACLEASEHHRKCSPKNLWPWCYDHHRTTTTLSIQMTSSQFHRFNLKVT